MTLLHTARPLKRERAGLLKSDFGRPFEKYSFASFVSFVSFAVKLSFVSFASFASFAVKLLRLAPLFQTGRYLPQAVLFFHR
jgi:hypothetical protein